MFFSSPLWLMMWRWIEGGRMRRKKNRREPAKQLDKTDFHFKQKFQPIFLLIVGELQSIMGQFDRTNRWLISAFFHDLSLEVAVISFLGVWRLAEQLISRPFSIAIARAEECFFGKLKLIAAHLCVNIKISSHSLNDRREGGGRRAGGSEELSCQLKSHLFFSTTYF